MKSDEILKTIINVLTKHKDFAACPYQKEFNHDGNCMQDCNACWVVAIKQTVKEQGASETYNKLLDILCTINIVPACPSNNAIGHGRRFRSNENCAVKDVDVRGTGSVQPLCRECWFDAIEEELAKEVTASEESGNAG